MRPTHTKRGVIVHHHIFKNAGTSVDFLLRESFGPRWAPLEGSRSGEILRADRLVAFLERHPDVRAVSSHQARLLPRPHDGFDIYPIVFIRHPIDRAASVYHFLTRRPAAAEGPHAADPWNFAEYVRWSLRDTDDATCVIRSYQTIHLSDALLRVDDAPRARATPADLTLAKERLAVLPAFGIVDRFEESCTLLGAWLRPRFAELELAPVACNTTPGRDGDLAERVRQVEAALGRELFRRLLDANAYDLELYRLAGQRFAGQLRRLAPAHAASRS